MNEPFIFLLLAISALSLEYSPKNEATIFVYVNFEDKNFIVKAPTIFYEYILHPETDLCLENKVNSSVTVKFSETNEEGLLNEFLKIPQGEMRAFTRNSESNWENVARNGINLTVLGLKYVAYGTLILKRCTKHSIVAVNGTQIRTEVVPYTYYDSKIHLPFYGIANADEWFYVDFSTIFAKKLRYYHDWQRRTICVNATIGGLANLNIRRCKSDEPYFFTLGIPYEGEYLMKYWYEYLRVNDKCPNEEEVLPDHLWIHVDIRDDWKDKVCELVFYNCDHTYTLTEENEEKLVVTPKLVDDQVSTISNDYLIPGYRKSVIFTPLKHIVDYALFTGSQINVRFHKDIPETVYYSSCYNSGRQVLYNEHHNHTTTFNLTREEISNLASYASYLNCSEQKPSYGVYLTIGAGESKLLGCIEMRLIDVKLPVTPPGVTGVSEHSTVPFLLQKGQRITKHVNYYELFSHAYDNTHKRLYHYFNCTGNVKLSLSRCENSPQLVLVDSFKQGSVRVSEDEVAHVMKLYNDTYCLDHKQAEHWYYKGDHQHGVIVHIEALEDTEGYFTLYEKLEATVYWNVINESRLDAPQKPEFTDSSVYNPGKSWVRQTRIEHILTRAVHMPPVSLRLRVQCDKPCQFGFSDCDTDPVDKWMEVLQLSDQRYDSWWTFDKESLNLLRSYAASTRCYKTNKSFTIHLRGEKPTEFRFTFALFDGVDVPDDFVRTTETPKVKSYPWTHIIIFIAAGISLVGIVITLIFLLIDWRKNNRAAAARNPNELIELNEM